MKDEIFQDPGRRGFAFDEQVAAVFEDMLERSVPFYPEIQSMIVELIDSFVSDNGRVYDLGCSTGTTLALLSQHIERSLELVGVDNSPAMLAKAEKKLLAFKSQSVSLIERDLNQGMDLTDANAVILNLVLQFVQPANREQLIRSIYSGLSEGGCLILIEKVDLENPLLAESFINHYHEFKKRNLYTDKEIARKREALEDILVPYTAEQNIALLQSGGFESVETFFRWFNFWGAVAIK